ncbi:Uncharacterised protein [uncultured archaeon]|nr:Uncharacterised protein [uncultured archaeon]
MLAQGATEYIILLGIALIVALAGVAVLGFMNGTVSDAQLIQSSMYWVAATPIAIVEHAVSAQDGTATIIIKNNDLAEGVTILEVALGNASNSTSFQLGPGKQALMSVSGLGAHAQGSVYDLNVTIAYNSSYGLMKVQHGTKNLVGKYS